MVVILRKIVSMGTGQNPPPDKTPLGPNPPSGQNPPLAKTPLRPKPPSCKNPSLAKTPLRQKAPSGKKNILSTPILSILLLLSNEYYESYKHKLHKL